MKLFGALVKPLAALLVASAILLAGPTNAQSDDRIRQEYLAALGSGDACKAILILALELTTDRVWINGDYKGWMRSAAKFLGATDGIDATRCRRETLRGVDVLRRGARRLEAAGMLRASNDVMNAALSEIMLGMRIIVEQ